MPTNNYNQSFLESPDPVTGLQRRTGQNFLDLKQTLHERLTLEHDFDPNDSGSQPEHGTHRLGSAKAYVDPDDFPTLRPTGENKEGTEIQALLLDEFDTGRLLIKGPEFYYWSGDDTLPADGEWVLIDTTPVGMIQMWSGLNGSVPSVNWIKCDGNEDHLRDDYPLLFALYGDAFGGNGTTTFGVPNMQGISTVGAGQQTDYLGESGRTKGSNAAIGDYVEDAMQRITGSFRMAEGSYRTIAYTGDGAFQFFYNQSDIGYSMQESGQDQSSSGFAFNMEAGGVRASDQETTVSSFVVDYYVKAK